MTNGRRTRPILLGGLAVGVVAIPLLGALMPGGPAPDAAPQVVPASDDAPAAPADIFTVRINRPDGPPVAEVRGPDGGVASVSCVVCHSQRASNPANRVAADLDEFHRGMTIAHGDLTCVSCHHPDQADRLRLADGRALDYPDVMTLCGQCHGGQFRSYEHGAHGGMNGYWDLTRGPRVRHNCVDCHDPHAPQFPRMIPTFKPRDRFLTPDAREHPHE